MAAFRPIGVDKDSATYVEYFYERNKSAIEVEPSFLYLVSFIKDQTNSPRLLFITYALFSVPLFCFVLNRLSPTPHLSMCVWIANFFILQNLTQMRVAVSVAFFALGLHALLHKRRLLYLICSLLGVFFHYSAIFFFLGILFSNKYITRKETYILASIPIISFILAIGHIDIVSLIPIPYMQERLRQYTALNEQFGEKINYFNISYLLHLVVYYFILWKQRILAPKVYYLPIITRVFGLSILLYVSLSFLPVLASRISELFSVVEVFMIPSIIYAFIPKKSGIALVSIYCLGIILFNIFHLQLLQF